MATSAPQARIGSKTHQSTVLDLALKVGLVMFWEPVLGGGMLGGRTWGFYNTWLRDENRQRIPCPSSNSTLD